MQSTHHLEEAVLEALQSFGFRASQCNGFYSFGIVARKGTTLLFIKTIHNLDNFKESEARDLSTLSNELSAAAIVVTEHTNAGGLDEDVVYERYGVPAVTLPTFESCLEEKYPRVKAVRGGFSVEIDTGLMQRRRKESGLSVGAIAHELGCSVRIVIEYERKGRASIQNAMALEGILDAELTKPIQIFSQLAARSIAQDIPAFEKDVAERMKALGFKVAYANKAPFNIVAEDEDDILVGGLRKAAIEEKAMLLEAISEVMDANPMFVLKRYKKDSIKGVPVIKKKQLDEVSSSEEFVIKFL